MFSGGALLHTGYLNVINTSFVGNQAGQEGLAVISFGVIQEASNLKFVNNVLSCSIKEYGYENNAGEVTKKTENTVLGVCFFFTKFYPKFKHNVLENNRHALLKLEGFRKQTNIVFVNPRLSSRLVSTDLEVTLLTRLDLVA